MSLPDFSLYFTRERELPGEPVFAKYRRVEEDTYHAWPAVSNSILKAPTPAHMLYEVKGGEPAKTSDAGEEAKVVGTLTHWATLEPHRLKQLINPATFSQVAMECPTKGLATKEAILCRRDNPGKLVLRVEHIVEAIQLEKVIERTAAAFNLLRVPAHKEISGFAFLEGIWRKWRVDFLPSEGSAEFLLDVKTTRQPISGDYGKRKWISECWKMGYWNQMAFYLHHHEMTTGMRPKAWKWVVVSKADSVYCARVFTCANPHDKNPLYAQSMIKTAREILGLDPSDSPGRLAMFREAATRTAEAQKAGDPIDERLLWEGTENEEETEIGYRV